MSAYVGPKDIKKRLQQEYPDITVTLINQHGLDSNFEVTGEKARQAHRRIRELAQRARLFNAHLDLGHVRNKRNWWDVIYFRVAARPQRLTQNTNAGGQVRVINK